MAVVDERLEEENALPVQRLVYFISEVLSETKVRYPQVQKLIYAVILARRKLQHYFLGHPITVVSSFPLGEIIQNREATGRIAKWSVELMGETLTYASRKAIKSQALADFIAEWTHTQLPPAQVQAERWTMYFDRSLMKIGAEVGLLFISPLGVHMRYVIRIHFIASNNVAEYEALINGLRIAIELGVRCLDVQGDSQLVIDQVMKTSSCHDLKMEAYCKEVRKLEDKFHGLKLIHIARRYNEAADELAKIVSTLGTIPPDAFSKDQLEPSIDLGSGASVETSAAEPTDGIEALLTAVEVIEVEQTPRRPGRPFDWRTPFLDCLIQGKLPEDRAKACRIAQWAKSYVIYGKGKELYRRSPTRILQRCITIEEGRKLLEDLHSGACGHHAAPRTLIGNAFRQGFY